VAINAIEAAPVAATAAYNAYVAANTYVVFAAAGGSGAIALYEDSEAVGQPSFFEGTYYGNKVLADMAKGPGEFHGFPQMVGDFESHGIRGTITGGDGIVRQTLLIQGSYQNRDGTWIDGVFEFYKNSNGEIVHRFFRPR
jgi:hypothetical protein